MNFRKTLKLPLCLAAAALPMLAGNAGGQASITLTDSGANICYSTDTSWDITKDNNTNGTIASGGTVTWTVHVTKDSTSDKTICVVGFVSIKNTGSAPATVGNIVLNLQKRSGTKWVSAAADMADATHGDAATFAHILAAASQESTNGIDYATAGQQGTFHTTAASGTLEFTDASDNSVFSLVPEVSIPAGQEITLLFTSKFDNSILNLPVGAPLRAEVIVSFGNAGARGGSGASGSNIDINGNGVIDADEANVRSVPTRLGVTLPALQNCNSTVTLTDVISSTGNPPVTVTPGQNDIGSGVTVSATGDYTVIATLTGSGTSTNSAFIDGASSSITITGSLVDPITMQPVHTFTVPCCTGTHQEADSTVIVDGGTGFHDGDFCTYTVEEYKNPHKLGYSLIANDFSAAFPSGLTIGNVGGNYHATWGTASPGPANLASFLGSSNGGSDGPLTATTSNPTSLAGSSLTKELAALALNVGFSGAAGGTPSGFGSLHACNGTPVDGMSIDQILNLANEYSGTVASSPTPFSDATALRTFLQDLNASFTHGSAHACKVSAFAQANLCQ